MPHCHLVIVVTLPSEEEIGMSEAEISASIASVLPKEIYMQYLILPDKEFILSKAQVK